MSLTQARAIVMNHKAHPRALVKNAIKFITNNLECTQQDFMACVVAEAGL